MMKTTVVIRWALSGIGGILIGLGLPPNGWWVYLVAGITIFLAGNVGVVLWEIRRR